MSETPASSERARPDGREDARDDLTLVIDAALSHAEYECSEHDHAVAVKAACDRLLRAARSAPFDPSSAPRCGPLVDEPYDATDTPKALRHIAKVLGRGRNAATLNALADRLARSPEREAGSGTADIGRDGLAQFVAIDQQERMDKRRVPSEGGGE